MKLLKISLLLSVFGILFFHIPTISAQDFPIDQESGKITYTEVVTLENNGATQEQLYSIAREWFATTYNSANDVLQMDDKELGKLIGKGGLPIITTAYLTDSQVEFTISVFVKEGRYKYIITDLVHESYKGQDFSGGALENVKPDCPGMNMMKKGWKQVKEQTAERVVEIITDLKKTMAGGEGKASDDDW